MSWLRDPDTGDLAAPLSEKELELLKLRAGRRRQRKGWHWVVKRNPDGSVEGVELRPIPSREKGLGDNW